MSTATDDDELLGIRDYLRAIRRSLLLIAAATFVCGAFALVIAGASAKSYTSTAVIQLLPNDPSEQVGTASNPPADIQRYIADQASIAQSDAVAQIAAKTLGQSDIGSITHNVTVSQAQSATSISVTGKASTADRAQALANAVAKGYIALQTNQTVSALQAAAAQIGTQLASLGAQIQSSNNAGQVAALQQTYGQLLLQQQQDEAAIPLQHGNALLQRPAPLPIAPTSPRPKRTALIGAVLGLMIGIGITLARTAADDVVRSKHSAVSVSRLPYLGSFPRLDRRADATVADLATEPVGPIAEAARRLRTSFALPGASAPSVIAVVSANAGEGRTVVATSLAAAFAATGRSTLLVDADLRHGRLDDWFAVEHHIGLRPLLDAVVAAGSEPDPSFDAKLAEAIVPSGLDHLDVLAAGAGGGHPTELLTSTTFKTIMRRVRQTYSLVVIDTPPALAYADAAAAIAGAGASSLLVVAVDETAKSELADATELLQRAGPLLGLTVTKSRERRLRRFSRWRPDRRLRRRHRARWERPRVAAVQFDDFGVHDANGSGAATIRTREPGA